VGEHLHELHVQQLQAKAACTAALKHSCSLCLHLQSCCRLLPPPLLLLLPTQHISSQQHVQQQH
jgi:hypothetical protein